MMKEAIQRDCTEYAPGIEIIGVRVTKPPIPHSIARNYEIMEEERTRYPFSDFFSEFEKFSPGIFRLDLQFITS